MTEQLADATRKRAEECAECGQQTTAYRLVLSPINHGSVAVAAGAVVCERCWSEIVRLLEAE